MTNRDKRWELIYNTLMQDRQLYFIESRMYDIATTFGVSEALLRNILAHYGTSYRKERYKLLTKLLNEPTNTLAKKLNVTERTILNYKWRFLK